MGDSAKLAKAKRELEELYCGIPDDSVNLTFGDLAEVRQSNGRSHNPHPPLEGKNSSSFDPIAEASPRREEVTPLAKLPSLDFSRALEASAQFNYQSKHIPHMNLHHHHHNHSNNTARHDYNSQVDLNHLQSGLDHHDQKGHHHYGNGETPLHHAVIGSPYDGNHHGMQSSMVYDDMSQMSGFPERGGRRRPGIPHSNICTVCSNYVYVFRNRCLVCGRVYCRQCVSIGMGEMAEGRKCIECLGRRFSQRYIQRAGQLGCCGGYPSMVKQQELKWAEKGPRGTGENRHGRSGMMSRSRSPSPMLSVVRGNSPNIKTPPSFVSNSQASFVMGSASAYSPYYSPRNHPLPL